MPGLEELKVSLTKNGYFKVADVISKHPRVEVLDNINGVYPEINLNRVQIAKMLSADPNGNLPSVWDEVRSKSKEAINALVLISIVYSHKELITAFKNSINNEMRGRLSRSLLGEKAYTNLVYSLESAGLCRIVHGAADTDFDLKPLFRDLSIGPLAKEILKLKLKQTGWIEPPLSDYFTRNFYEQCFYYEFHKTLGLSEQQFEEWLEGRRVQFTQPPNAVPKNTEISVSATLITALSTKPFVIVSGTTGTGKTRTVRHLVDQLCPLDVDKSFNHVFIPVEAGWTDARHLLGYKNPFGKQGETYVSTPLIELLLRANYPEYKQIPFFIILDEMNLSYVEMYFAKFLSLMETSYDNNTESIVEIEDLQLMLRSENSNAITATYIDSAIQNGGLKLNNNVFIIGTVNVDETTHMFSPKVLDRAFVIEYNTQKPSETGFSFALKEEDLLSGQYTKLTELLIHKKLPISKYDAFLDEIHAKLDKFSFGPRTTNEVRLYANSIDFIEKNLHCHPLFINEASIKDRLLMEKILPKLHGNKGQLMQIINDLFSYCNSANMNISVKKLSKMKQELEFPGFTSYFS